jgi:4-hydroxybenzoyl-CoA thioesterase
VWRASDKASGREVARGKTGIIFFDYRKKPGAVPAGFRAKAGQPG